MTIGMYFSLSQMSTIPQYRDRLQAMIFKLHFFEKLQEIQPVSIKASTSNWSNLFYQDLYAIIDASQQLRNSKKLKKILEVTI